MLGERTEQRGLWEADRMYLDYVGKDTFYGLLASLRGQLFRDADFAEFYCLDNGRTSVPPSLLATALLLQTYDKVSDAEAKARGDFDIRWKVALGKVALGKVALGKVALGKVALGKVALGKVALGKVALGKVALGKVALGKVALGKVALGKVVEDRPFAKSTLQVFRGQLILRDQVHEVFERSLRLARETGYLKRRSLRVALDTTYILGRGAVKDTYNLLADGMVKLLRALAAVDRTTVKAWAEAQGYQRYLGSSVKGEAAIDWSSKRERRKLLAEVVADADRLLELARQARDMLDTHSVQRREIVEAAELLGQLLLQDVERKGGDDDGHGDGGVSLKEGVSRDRMMSVHDPEMRHGRQSSSKRFDGHQAAIVVDTDTQLITAVDMLPGNAPDNLGALDLVEQSEANAEVLVTAALGDTAYGDGGTRQAFADAGRKLVAKVPGRPNRKHFPKHDFHLDLAAGSCTCPAGQVTHTIVPVGKRTDRTGRVHQLQAFQFHGAVCGVCPLRSQCIAAKGRRGRRVPIHPQEARLQQARALQQSADYDEYRQLRVVVEHRLARLEQLGIRQARYFGRVKTKFQLYRAATVANLTLMAGKLGLTDDTGDDPLGNHVIGAEVVNTVATFRAIQLGHIWSLAFLTSALLPQSHFPNQAFRPEF